jgi:hypothetical protein
MLSGTHLHHTVQKVIRSACIDRGIPAIKLYIARDIRVFTTTKVRVDVHGIAIPREARRVINPNGFVAEGGAYPGYLSSSEA